MVGPHNFITEITLTLIGVLMGLEAAFLLGMGRKSLLHYVAAAFCLLMGAFIVLFGFSSVAISVDSYTALSRVSELMSVIVMPLFLHGILLLSLGKAKKAPRPLQAIVYAPALVLLACASRDFLLVEGFYLDESGVWNGINRSGGWPFLLYWAYAIACILAGLGLLLSWRLRAEGEAEKMLSRRLGRATILTLSAFLIAMAGNLVYIYRNSPWRDYVINLFFSLAFYFWILAYRRAIVGMTGGPAEAASGAAMVGGRERERIHRGLAELFSQPVFLLDREGRIEHCNQAAAGAFGLRGEELRGRPLAPMFADGERIAEALRSPSTESAILARREGRGQGMALTLRSILGDSGMVAGFLCLCAEVAPNGGPAPAAAVPLAPGEEISSREYEVLFLLAEGLGVEGIGQRLFISPSTVKTHIHHLYQKTGARNRVELIKLVDAR
jgi:PAS domain S-box-containing protein